jgi:hypothetical protein
MLFLPFQLRFFLDTSGEEYARRYLTSIPCIGDEVRFNGQYYKITYRLYIYDEEETYGDRSIVSLLMTSV